MLLLPNSLPCLSNVHRSPRLARMAVFPRASAVSSGAKPGKECFKPGLAQFPEPDKMTVKTDVGDQAKAAKAAEKAKASAMVYSKKSK